MSLTLVRHFGSLFGPFLITQLFVQSQGLKVTSYPLSDKVFVDIEQGKGKVDFDQRKQLIVSMTYSDWANIIKASDAVDSTAEAHLHFLFP